MQRRSALPSGKSSSEDMDPLVAHPWYRSAPEVSVTNPSFASTATEPKGEGSQASWPPRLRAEST